MIRPFGGEGGDHLDAHAAGRVHVALDVGDGDTAQLALREAQQEAADLLQGVNSIETFWFG